MLFTLLNVIEKELQLSNLQNRQNDLNPQKNTSTIMLRYRQKIRFTLIQEQNLADGHLQRCQKYI